MMQQTHLHVYVRSWHKGLLLVLLSGLFACSTPVAEPTVIEEAAPSAKPVPMSLGEAAPGIKENSQGLFLLSLTIRNELAPNYQPDALFVRLEQMLPGRPSRLLRFNVLPNDLFSEGDRKSGKTYLLRLPLDPGAYRLLGLNLSAGQFPVKGFGFLPIHADFAAPSGGNFYLGHVLGVNRQKQPGEFQSGPSTPQPDQSVTGFAQGTFDVTVQDLSEQDLPRYRSRFPEIEALQIETTLLPPIDRRRAQAYWEER